MNPSRSGPILSTVKAECRRIEEHESSEFMWSTAEEAKVSSSRCSRSDIRRGLALRRSTLTARKLSLVISISVCLYLFISVTKPVLWVHVDQENFSAIVCMYSLILAYFFWAMLNNKDSASQKDSVENIRKRSYATDTEKDAAEDKKDGIARKREKVCAFCI